METALKPTFKEVQKFKRNGLWVTIVVAGLMVIGVFGLAFYTQIIRGIKFGNHPAGDVELIIVSIIGVSISCFTMLWLEIAKLITEIDEHGINYKFLPFHRQFRDVSWDLIDKYYVMSSFQGHEYLGYKLGRKVYDVGSDKCLVLKLKTGEKILLGTRKEKELVAFLNIMKSIAYNKQ